MLFLFIGQFLPAAVHHPLDAGTNPRKCTHTCKRRLSEDVFMIKDDFLETIILKKPLQGRLYGDGC